MTGGVMNRADFAAEIGAPPRTRGGALTPTDVEARLIEAFEMLDRLPERGQGGSGQVAGIWRMTMREWSEYSPDTWANRVGCNLTAADVKRMDEALGWCEWLNPLQRRLLAIVVPMKAMGRTIPWAATARRIGWSVRGNALQMRYMRILNLITAKANAARED